MQPQECLGDGRIELGPGQGLDFVKSLIFGPGVLVRTNMRQGVEHVDDADDSRRDGNLGTLESGGVPASVPTLVVVQLLVSNLKKIT